VNYEEGVMLTKKQIDQEIIKCGKDPIYFIKMYCMIQEPIKGHIPFNLFPYQEELIHEFIGNRFNIVLKGRQLGISWLSSAFCLWLMLFRRNKVIMSVSTKEKVAAKIIEKVKYQYKHLPSFLHNFNGIDTDNNAKFKLTNGSEVVAETTTSDSGRSYSLSLLIIDEAAYVENLDGDQGLWTALQPTLATGGRAIAFSSPAGASGWFYETYSRAAEKQNRGEADWNPIKLMWWVHPNRDDEWFEAQKTVLQPKALAQEHLCDFSASGDTVVSSDDLIDLKRFLDSIEEGVDIPNKEPLARTSIDRNYWIWKKYDPNHTYVMGCDTARGDGKDFSTFHIMDVITNEVVAEYEGKQPADVFAEIIYNAAQEYGFPLCAVEKNMGDAVLMKLREKNLPNIYCQKRGTSEYIPHAQIAYDNSVVVGFVTSARSKALIMAKMEEYIRMRKVKIYSERLYNQFLNFIWDATGKAGSKRGYNDDLVMSFAITCWLRDTAIEIDSRNRIMDKAILSAIVVKGKQFDSSLEGSRGFYSGPELQRKSKMQLEVEKRKKYSWLYDPIYKG
jgi:hypothetical protein